MLIQTVQMLLQLQLHLCKHWWWQIPGPASPAKDLAWVLVRQLYSINHTHLNFRSVKAATRGHGGMDHPGRWVRGGERCWICWKGCRGYLRAVLVQQIHVCQCSASIFSKSIALNINLLKNVNDEVLQSSSWMVCKGRCAFTFAFLKHSLITT